MSSVVLPPLSCAEVHPTFGERLVNGAAVLALHLFLGYAALYLSVKNDLIQLPQNISVRLLPMIEEKKVEPVKPLPPPPKPASRPPKILPQPVLAVASKEPGSSSFAVAPQPPATPVEPIAAVPAPPAPLVAARFDADYLHNPKPVYPVFSRRNGEEGKVLLKVRVSAQGTALDVAISKSSGFTRLDGAAVEAVTRWRFVPARRGNEAVDSSVIVPITFAFD